MNSLPGTASKKCGEVFNYRYCSATLRADSPRLGQGTLSNFECFALQQIEDFSVTHSIIHSRRPCWAFTEDRTRRSRVGSLGTVTASSPPCCQCCYLYDVLRMYYTPCRSISCTGSKSTVGRDGSMFACLQKSGLVTFWIAASKHH
jgi:hypothetical protein